LETTRQLILPIKPLSAITLAGVLLTAQGFPPGYHIIIFHHPPAKSHARGKGLSRCESARQNNMEISNVFRWRSAQKLQTPPLPAQRCGSRLKKSDLHSPASGSSRFSHGPQRGGWKMEVKLFHSSRSWISRHHDGCIWMQIRGEESEDPVESDTREMPLANILLLHARDTQIYEKIREFIKLLMY